MTDDLRVLTAFLTTTGTGLYTLVGTRVYYGDLPSGFDNTQAAVQFVRRGGNRDAYLATARGDYQFKCYGGSGAFKDAESVYRALGDRLHAQVNQSNAYGAIIDATEDGMGQALTDPDSGWPFILCHYTINTRA